MQSLAQRALIGLSVAAIGAGVLTAGTPAFAEASQPVIETQGEVQAAGQWRKTLHDVGLLNTPRRGVPPIAQIPAGAPVEAFCAFANDGQEWVKIQHSGQFGFVPNTSITGGNAGLPRECPSEVETIDIPVFNHDFTWGEHEVPLKGFTCPTGQPFLLDHKYHLNPFMLVPKGVRVTNEDRLIHANAGNPTATTYNGVKYVNGFEGGSVSHWGTRLLQNGQVWATCTNNVAKAYQP